MSWLLPVVALAAGLACPLHMWWSQRRGTRAACCAPRNQEPAAEAAALWARQQVLRAQIVANGAELERLN